MLGSFSGEELFRKASCLASRFSSLVRCSGVGPLDSVEGAADRVEVFREAALLANFVRFDVLAIANSSFWACRDDFSARAKIDN